jgi:hypothetical protein
MSWLVPAGLALCAFSLLTLAGFTGVVIWEAERRQPASAPYDYVESPAGEGRPSESDRGRRHRRLRRRLELWLTFAVLLGLGLALLYSLAVIEQTR